MRETDIAVTKRPIEIMAPEIISHDDHDDRCQTETDRSPCRFQSQEQQGIAENPIGERQRVEKRNALRHLIHLNGEESEAGQAQCRQDIIDDRRAARIGIFRSTYQQEQHGQHQRQEHNCARQHIPSR